MIRLFPLLVLLLLLGAMPASAHTAIASTTPEANSTVAEPPSELVVEFSGDLLPGSTVEARVIDPAGDDIVAGQSTVEARTATIPLNLSVVEGEYTVDVAFTAADGDDQVETFSFTFAPATAVATPTEDLTGPPVQPATEQPTEAPNGEPTAEPTAEPTPTPTPTPTPQPAVSAPTAPPSEEGELLSLDDGGLGVGGLVLGLAGLLAVGAVIAIRLRQPHEDG